MGKIVPQADGLAIGVREKRLLWKLFAIVLLGLMLWFPHVAAGEKAESGMKGAQSEILEADSRKPARTEKGKGMALFWIGLGLSILFVLGSALALNALGGKRPSRDDRDKGGGAS